MAYYLQMDGVDDLLRSPQLTISRVVMDFVFENNPPATTAYYLWDNRGGTPSGNYMGYISTTNILSKGSAISTFILDGVSGTSFSVTPGTRYVVDYEYTAVTTDANGLEFFVNYVNQNTTRIKGRIYDIKLYNGTTLIAHYDMTLGNVQDQSGNGNHATLTGGTWVQDTVGPITNDGTTALTGLGTLAGQGVLIQNGNTALTGLGSLTASAILQADGSTTLSGVGTLQANGNLYADATTLLQGIGSLEGVVLIPKEGTALLQGAGTLQAIGHLLGWVMVPTVQTTWTEPNPAQTTWNDVNNPLIPFH